MPKFPLPPNNTRLGFHYYPDTNHYRQSDLQTWLPELHSLGVSWLTLQAPIDRAIPEYFLTELIAAGIEPILHLPLPLSETPSLNDLDVIFSAYAHWGIHYIVLYDRPNNREAWPTDAWAQSDLVERFLDRFIPAAQTALKFDLNPVLPPLEPGGDFWDTTFLRSALRGIARRGQTEMVSKLVLGAYAHAGSRPLNWGMGGPERWPGTRPYFTPPGQQDQIGFHIFDWYLTISRAVFGNASPILLFEAGSFSKDSSAQDPRHTDRNFALLQAILKGEPTPVSDTIADLPGPIPEPVLGCNFWLLAADSNTACAHQAWYRSEGTALPIVDALRQSVHGSRSQPAKVEMVPTSVPAPASDNLASDQTPSQIISHYLLLPLFDWGISDWYLDAIRPFVKKFHPTIGFSLQEAACAAKVTVVGSRHLIPDSELDQLRAAGSFVERIDGDGTSIATKLASR